MGRHSFLAQVGRSAIEAMPFGGPVEEDRFRACAEAELRRRQRVARNLEANAFHKEAAFAFKECYAIADFMREVRRKAKQKPRRKPRRRRPRP